MVLEPPEIAYIRNMLLDAFSGVRCPLLSADFGGVFELMFKDGNEMVPVDSVWLSVDGVRAIKPDAFCQLSHTQQWVCGVR